MTKTQTEVRSAVEGTLQAPPEPQKAPWFVRVFGHDVVETLTYWFEKKKEMRSFKVTTRRVGLFKAVTAVELVRKPKAPRPKTGIAKPAGVLVGLDPAAPAIDVAERS